MRMFIEQRPEACMQLRFERLERRGIVVRRSGVGAVVGHAATAAKRRHEVRQWRLARFSWSRRTILVSVRCIRENGRSVSVFPVQFGVSASIVASSLRSPNKAPEPTPGLVTSRAEVISDIVSSRKARLAPSPVVAHL